jgi:hypothetical protein
VQPQHLLDADHHVGDVERAGRIDGPAPAVGRERRQRLPVRPGLRVAGVAERDGLGQRLGDGLRERHVHLGDERGQHVGLVERPLDARAATQVGQAQLVQRVHTTHPATGVEH